MVAVVLEKPALFPLLLDHVPPEAEPLSVAVTVSVETEQIESVVWLSITPGAVLTTTSTEGVVEEQPAAAVSTHSYQVFCVSVAVVYVDEVAPPILEKPVEPLVVDDHHW